MLAKSTSASQRGFTLIELMIVMTIISILAAILFPVLMRARLKSYHTACIQNVRNLASALQMYANEHDNRYPSSLNELTVHTNSSSYIQSIETCPSNQTSYTLGYTVSEENGEYLLACPGIHELQLTGLVRDGYPQIVSGELYANGPP